MSWLLSETIAHVIYTCYAKLLRFRYILKSDGRYYMDEIDLSIERYSEVTPYILTYGNIMPVVLMSSVTLFPDIIRYPPTRHPHLYSCTFCVPLFTQ